jgi:hypothetical protein
VLAVTDGVPEKLICSACGSVHRFRADGPITVPRAARSSAARVPSASRGGPAASSFDSLVVQERAAAIAKPYGQGAPWREGMWLDHPSFGLGKVQRRFGQKINVLFQSGVKTLMAL